MSRAVTPTTSQPAAPVQAKIPHEKIAMRAYENWLKRGKPAGNPECDWLQAENELRAECSKGQTAPNQPQNAQRR